MRRPEYDTVVRSITGKPELRRVTEVQEWRIEQELDSSRFVISVVSAGGEAQSFLVALTDAQDIGDVLQRKAAGLAASGG
ncbi:hypothetical protein SRS16CHR_00192 [Variovorax sp. SRS16]|uniref:hypothetical protein n=1 Tax=Variovorax sp. SRS16 TaxID=282217 RepID=UPI0013192A70|nr:hypothetical protein [Variovorax sp. SRS16]VTU12953.1 hypothetical protein SRS16CHR_00192 [Variovorax sp. SRS16]